MKKIELYIIKDNVSGEFSMPLAYNNKEAALRHFLSIIKHLPNLSGSDYQLYKLANFDILCGELSDIKLELVNSLVESEVINEEEK